MSEQARLFKLKELIERHAWEERGATETRDLIYSYLCAWTGEPSREYRQPLESTGPAYWEEHLGESDG